MAQKQKTGAKFGRNRKRPSCITYASVKRWMTNAIKAKAKDDKRKQDKLDNPPKVPRGTARWNKRAEKRAEFARMGSCS